MNKNVDNLSDLHINSFYKSLLSFKSDILKYSSIQKKVNNFSICFTNEIKRINQLRVGLSPLNEHKFNHNFADVLSPLCLWGQKA